VSDHQSDDERLAAFLDGRMDARRREEMLADLNRSDEDRAVLMGTAAILRQLEQPEQEAAAPAAGEEPAEATVPEGVIPLDTRRAPPPDDEVSRTRAPVFRRLALAAVLAGLALVTGRALLPRGSANDPVRLAARLEDRELPERWTDNRSWGVRGDNPRVARTPREKWAQGAEAGALLVDLAVAVDARDSARTHLLATQIAGRFDRQGGRRGALREIIDGAGSSPRRLRPRIADATERIAKRLDGEALRLGAWTEAALLAAVRHDAGFFREGDAGEMLDRAARLPTANARTRAALRQVRSLLASEPLQWGALGPALETLLGELATE